MATPSMLGPYPVECELGRGGTGIVYLARDPRLNRQVAIKVLPDIHELNADRLARFEREARLVASLNHPHIAAIHGVEEVNARQVLILEYVPGETLAERCRSARFRWTRRSTSAARSRWRWNRPTMAASFTATSSRATSRSRLTDK